MPNMTRIYLSGPMTGYPEFNHPAFYEYANLLREKGFAVISPAEMAGNREGMTWVDFLRQDIRFIADCDGIALMPGWEKSRGARLELIICILLQMRVLDATTGESYSAIRMPQWFWKAVKLINMGSEADAPV